MQQLQRLFVGLEGDREVRLGPGPCRDPAIERDEQAPDHAKVQLLHSLKQGEKNVLGEATILKRLGDNDYLAEYNGVKCHAMFNPFVGRYFVDDVYGIVRSSPERGER